MAESTLVLLGFVDQPIKDQLNIDWGTNKIGGEAIFPESIEDRQLSTLANDQLICPNCVKLCSSICQIQCAVDDNPAARVIYVFACLQDGCNHFAVLRLIHRQQSSPSTTFCPKVSSQQSNQRQIWGTDSSNWSDDESDEENSNFSKRKDYEEQEQEEATSLESSHIQKGKFLPKSLTVESNQGFQPFYIYVENLEDLKYSKSFVTKKEAKYSMDNGDDLSIPNEDGEKYENPEVATIFANDQISYKFYKNLRDWPGQIIRYSWEGQPLFNKSIGKPRVDDCSNCGSERSFELQLMPGLISQLKPSSSTQSASIDFGTVLIYCCSNNCDNQTFNEEKCIFLEDLDNNVINGFVTSRD